MAGPFLLNHQAGGGCWHVCLGEGEAGEGERKEGKEGKGKEGGEERRGKETDKRRKKHYQNILIKKETISIFIFLSLVVLLSPIFPFTHTHFFTHYFIPHLSTYVPPLRHPSPTAYHLPGTHTYTPNTFLTLNQQVKVRSEGAVVVGGRAGVRARVRDVRGADGEFRHPAAVRGALRRLVPEGKDQ